MSSGAQSPSPLPHQVPLGKHKAEQSTGWGVGVKDRRGDAWVPDWTPAHLSPPEGFYSLPGSGEEAPGPQGWPQGPSPIPTLSASGSCRQRSSPALSPCSSLSSISLHAISSLLGLNVSFLLSSKPALSLSVFCSCRLDCLFSSLQVPFRPLLISLAHSILQVSLFLPVLKLSPFSSLFSYLLSGCLSVFLSPCPLVPGLQAVVPSTPGLTRQCSPHLRMKLGDLCLPPWGCLAKKSLWGAGRGLECRQMVQEK